jgi:hypothetical protein
MSPSNINHVSTSMMVSLTEDFKPFGEFVGHFKKFKTLLNTIKFTKTISYGGIFVGESNPLNSWPNSL